ncbi:MAG: oligopeptide transporter, OPT family [Candidatus Krumholzibacteria bacterium]|jgi:putative OPT family oligopeptide transporter|nr:oligopeptide transporter, OPT family [Candidatus Krumholzibacteria bacterium]MDP6668548.1 oligopeptide transporter, OPT family [Candidatus Krumholzibacteria bacterium]MDP6797124.1 oligopeptide transporter, OPT family [Candidatus Krumholzibacteria bacterium]MDP7021800.1 oligopeptide transporter, OPT family [Candidatus Krumholzibacteria bacterium]
MSQEKTPSSLSPLAYEPGAGERYEPVIPASQSPTELTLRAVIIGILLGALFGAANAYLGLKVGLTVSASIPAAVIAAFFFRVAKGSTLLESNMVQTVGSAGESVAAGVIFTIPAFFLWMQTDPSADPGRLKIFILALFGGLLGVLFMIPLRRYLIVKEHGHLPYPEGTACAEVLVSNQKGSSKAALLFQGLGLGMFYQILMHDKLFGFWKQDPSHNIRERYHIGSEVGPELLGVGYIVGPRIAGLMLGGAVLGVLVLVPVISWFRELGGMPFMGPEEIRGNYVKLIGAGAVAFGGIISLVRGLPTIVRSFGAGLKGFGSASEGEEVPRTQRDLPLKGVGIAAAVIILALWFLPDSIMPVNLAGAISMVVFAFIFVTVSSRVVGLVGGSSLPVSGMTIATLLGTAALFVALGYTGTAAKYAVLSVGAVVCIAASIAGDTSQDLKTGFLLGATPRHQQIGEFVGVITSALVMALVIYLFRADIVSGALKAPQANLMRTIIDSVISRDVPWDLLIAGGFAAVVVELLGMNSLAFAVGLYLPIELSVPVFLGGSIRWWTERKFEGDDRNVRRERGVLYSSGLIAGAAMVGLLAMILVAIATRLRFLDVALQWMQNLTEGMGHAWPFLPFAVLVFFLWQFSHGRIRKEA